MGNGKLRRGKGFDFPSWFVIIIFNKDYGKRWNRIGKSIKGTINISVSSL